MCTYREGLYKSCIKFGEISNFGFLLFFFFSFSLTWDHMGEKTSNYILSESEQQICSQKVMHTPRKGLYQSYVKNCEFSNFRFLAIFVFVLFLDV